MERFLRFEHVYRGGLHAYAVRAGESDIPGPVWSGLWEQQYPEDPKLNPWNRHAINNCDGEALAVWRALAWALSASRSRFAIPCYYRDEAAQLLGVDRTAIRLVRWEYEFNVEQPDWSTADVGFVPARAAVHLRPPADSWERDHAGFAGLFELATFQQFTDLDRAVGFDASSEITLFALDAHNRVHALAAGLNRTGRPDLADILQLGELFLDVAVVRDLGAGAASYLTVKATEPVEEIGRLADHFSRAYRRYLARAGRIRTFDEFHNAIDELLAPARTSS